MIFSHRKLNKKTYTVLVISLLILLLLVFYNAYKRSTVREGLAVIDDVKDAISKISKVAEVAEKIPKEITGLKDDIVNSTNVVKDSVGQIDNKLEDFLKKVEQTTIDIVTDKISSVLTQIGEIFKTALVDPIVTLTTGIGDIFIGIFGILREVANKIVSLPSCILTYAITSFFNAMYSVYSYIIPEVIRNIFTKIYETLFKWAVDWFLGVIGYTDSYNKCYGFDVNSSITKIEDSAKKIGDSFSSDFGRLDFSKISI
jgi:hypothetical protein